MRALRAWAGPLAVAAALLAGAEGLTRWLVSRRPPRYTPSGFETPPTYYNTPSIRIPKTLFERHIWYTNNALGLRGAETSEKKPAGRKRVLCIGDSVMYGVLVNDGYTLPALLQKRLDAARPGRWEVLNAAVGGYDAWDYAGWYARKGAALEPDVVVLGLYMNDHERADPRAPVAAPHRSWLTRLRDALRRSELVVGLQLALGSRLPPHRPLAAARKTVTPEVREAMARRLPGDPQSLEAVLRWLEEYRYEPFYAANTLPILMDLRQWDKIAAPLRSIRDSCARRGCRMLAVVFPAQFEVYPGYRFPEPRRRVAKLLAGLGVPSVDLRDAFAAAGGDRLYPQRGDWAHPDARAYGAGADLAYERLERLGWLE